MACLSRKLSAVAFEQPRIWDGFFATWHEHADAKVANPPPVHERARNGSAPVVVWLLGGLLICESSVSRSMRNSSPGVRSHRSAS